MNFDPGMFVGGLGSLVSGLFGNGGSDYEKAMEQYQKYGQQAANAQNPFHQAGVGAIGQYQDWLNKQQDPTKFINEIMGNYQESPYAHYLQNQSMRAGQNAASASGLTGSTPFAQQLQQNAGNIASADQNQWLQNVLGINTQYGQGQNNLMQGGQGAANQLSNIFNQMGQNMGQAAYGQQAGKNNDWFNKIGGALGLGLSFL